LVVHDDHVFFIVVNEPVQHLQDVAAAVLSTRQNCQVAHAFSEVRGRLAKVIVGQGVFVLTLDQ
jgi:hypothetical protein